jgi:hypothetical protein
MMIAMAAFSCSHHMCKIQKLMTIYFKSCGIATKVLDTLHTLGITMSQKWLYDGIKALSKCVHLDMVQDIARYPWFGIHNNVNIPFCVYQQCLDNQSHFDSGTAGMIVIIKDPACIPPSFADLKHSFLEGIKNPITSQTILQLDWDSSQCPKALAIHMVLNFLVEAPEFGFDTYKFKASPIFACPRSTNHLQAS